MDSITDGEMLRAEEVRGMTDFQKLIGVFDEIGQSYFLANEGEFTPCGIDFEYDCVIKIDSGAGYAGLMCEFYFLNGKRVGHGVWE